jgi:hypothetical protein
VSHGPIAPGSLKWARQQREKKRAKIYKFVPITIILDRQAEDSVVQPLSLQVDSGSQTTGFALFRKTEDPEAEEPFKTLCHETA